MARNRCLGPLPTRRAGRGNACAPGQPDSEGVSGVSLSVFHCLMYPNKICKRGCDVMFVMLVLLVLYGAVCDVAESLRKNGQGFKGPKYACR